jgi:hypothetical protein
MNFRVQQHCSMQFPSTVTFEKAKKGMLQADSTVVPRSVPTVEEQICQEAAVNILLLVSGIRNKFWVPHGQADSNLCYRIFHAAGSKSCFILCFIGAVLVLDRNFTASL